MSRGPEAASLSSPRLAPSALLGSVHGGESERLHFWRQRVDTEDRLRASFYCTQPGGSPRLARGFAHSANNSSPNMNSSLRMGFEGTRAERHSTETGSKLADTYREPLPLVNLEDVPPKLHSDLLCPSLGSVREVPRVRRTRLAPWCPKTQLANEATHDVVGIVNSVMGIGAPSVVWASGLAPSLGEHGARLVSGGAGSTGSARSQSAGPQFGSFGRPQTHQDLMEAASVGAAPAGSPGRRRQPTAASRTSEATGCSSARLGSVAKGPASCSGSARLSQDSRSGAAEAASKAPPQSARVYPGVLGMQDAFFPRQDRFVERLCK